ncbi:MAG: octanoyltransferase [Oceanospirillaceae bacterium]|jgi:lipoyl(octanoyl) transferase|uniref:lipoyl(octanoyl) transferase LipB n=1 Tax=unclassified Thalassolituus TaxID=2624967 RepID=UPI000B6EE9F5|nr:MULTISPECIES: lipoyl(octanoyl) transferase LipB [unclassified Thalassolituus]MAE35325.1 octanoyltransferase [Oceanospirillaceae bacterium]OUX67020.1 MAG: octanoyltransferase [Oceanospirillaceae bacterium TMED276]MBN56895.1 octanoyltransferase [Oceanospirillaceae bacterium]MDQ4424152.1 lipoyl(octanoyl) transferase LipB [Thalassolituus sp.]MDQ4425190.1 lipoyl(octanoyl) transferase LipB [Thalassolituus sp.]|tara:strand:+ start:146 stop:784 length:639 start_codon:yes stop_codon:yes gene_type:complete
MQIRMLGLADYQTVYDDMTAFTEGRNDNTADELWYLQHPPVFTQGQAGKAEHVLFPGDIPVVQTDRGGQVTYHGPGQLVVYLMIDIARRGWGPRQLVSAIEQAIVDTLAEWKIEAAPRSDAPGVYTGERKIASLGLRIRHGRSFHGLALNIDMDLEPFRRINPCGYAGMEMTQMVAETDNAVSFDAVADRLDYHLQRLLANDGAGTDNTTPE